MPLDPIVRFGGGPQIEELRAGLRSWLADHLPDEFRRTAANPDYLPRDAHERAMQFVSSVFVVLVVVVVVVARVVVSV